MNQCQRTHECSGERCSKEAAMQLCGVWMCQDHIDVLLAEPYAVYRLYMANKEPPALSTSTSR